MGNKVHQLVLLFKRWAVSSTQVACIVVVWTSVCAGGSACGEIRLVPN